MTPIKHLFAFIVYTLLSGCVTMEPYKPIVDALQQEQLETRERQGPLTVSHAVNYANDARLQLVTHIGERHKAHNYLATAEILLTSALLADAAIGHSKDATIIGSLLGISGLSIAQWVDDDRRPKLFALGATAIGCAVDAVSPLQNLEDLTPYIDALNQAMVQLVSAKSELSAIQAMSFNTQLSSYLTKILTLADSSYRSAEATIRQTESIQQKALSAGPQLKAVVDTILTKLVTGIVDTEKSLGELQNVLQNLVIQAKTFTGQDQGHLFDLTGTVDEQALVGMADKDSNGQFDTDFERALTVINRLGDALGHVLGLNSRLNAKVAAIGNLQSEQRLKQCGVQLADVLPPIVIVPPTPLPFTDKDGGKDGFTIYGGNKQYFATLMGGQEGITLNQKPFSQYVDIEVAGDNMVPPRDYRVEVRDSTGASATAIIRVTKSTGNTSTTGSQNETQAKRGEVAFCEKNPADSVCNLQLGLATFELLTSSSIDGACHTQTETAMQTFKSMAVLPDNTLAKCDNIQAFTQALDQIAGQLSAVTINKLALLVRQFELLMIEVSVDGISADGQLTSAELSAIQANQIIAQITPLDFNQLNTPEGAEKVIKQIIDFLNSLPEE